jgi:hypothetical protein
VPELQRSVEGLPAAQRPQAHQAVRQRLAVPQVPAQAQLAPVLQAQARPQRVRARPQRAAAREWLPAALPERARRPGPQRPAALRARERVVWRALVQRAEAPPARSALVCFRI